MAIKNILLDGGGVILDESAHTEAINLLLLTLIQQEIPGYTWEQLQDDIEDGVHRFCPKIYSYILWKRIPKHDVFHRYRDRFLQEWRTPPLVLMPGIHTQLIWLSQSHRLALAGQYGPEILTVLKDHGLLGCFASCATQDDFAITKPDPRYLELIMARCHMEPSESVMVGDRIDNDIIPAKLLGMKTIRVRLGMHRNQEPRTPEEFPDAEIPSVDYLADAIRSLE